MGLDSPIKILNMSNTWIKLAQTKLSLIKSFRVNAVSMGLDKVWIHSSEQHRTAFKDHKRHFERHEGHYGKGTSSQAYCIILKGLVLAVDWISRQNGKATNLHVLPMECVDLKRVYYPTTYWLELIRFQNRVIMCKKHPPKMGLSL